VLRGARVCGSRVRVDQYIHVCPLTMCLLWLVSVRARVCVRGVEAVQHNVRAPCTRAHSRVGTNGCRGLKLVFVHTHSQV
jgi:hypothetical protein